MAAILCTPQREEVRAYGTYEDNVSKIWNLYRKGLFVWHCSYREVAVKRHAEALCEMRADTFV